MRVKEVIRILNTSDKSADLDVKIGASIEYTSPVMLTLPIQNTEFKN